MTVSALRLAPGPGPWAARIALGAAYWLAFLVALDVDGILRRLHLDWSQELLRLAGATLLGALSVPIVLALIERCPVEGQRRLGRAAIHVAASAAIAFALVIVSSVLADWGLARAIRPLPVAIVLHLKADWLLLTFCVLAFDGLGHALRLRRSAGPRPLGRLMARKGRSVVAVDLGQVEWIETQGNYQALHLPGATHLVRETSAGLERRLDAARFIRIHRRALVAIDRIAEIATRPGGETYVGLASGARLRVSRSFAPRVRAAFTSRSESPRAG